MIPADTFLFDEEPETEEQPSLTYKMDIDKKQIRGFADELEAMKQAVYKILLTERYQYIMYSWDYGIETLDLYGEPVSFVYRFFANFSRKNGQENLSVYFLSLSAVLFSVFCFFPCRSLFQSFHAQADLLLICIEIYYFCFDFLSNLKNICRLIYMIMRDL